MSKTKRMVYSGSVGNKYQSSVKPTTRREHYKKKGKK